MWPCLFANGEQWQQEAQLTRAPSRHWPPTLLAGLQECVEKRIKSNHLPGADFPLGTYLQRAKTAHATTDRRPKSGPFPIGVSFAFTSTSRATPTLRLALAFILKLEELGTSSTLVTDWNRRQSGTIWRHNGTYWAADNEPRGPEGEKRGQEVEGRQFRDRSSGAASLSVCVTRHRELPAGCTQSAG